MTLRKGGAVEDCQGATKALLGLISAEYQTAQQEGHMSGQQSPAGLRIRCCVLGCVQRNTPNGINWKLDVEWVLWRLQSGLECVVYEREEITCEDVCAEGDVKNNLNCSKRVPDRISPNLCWSSEANCPKKDCKAKGELWGKPAGKYLGAFDSRLRGGCFGRRLSRALW